jgi:hypothetical protein
MSISYATASAAVRAMPHDVLVRALDSEGIMRDAAVTPTDWQFCYTDDELRDFLMSTMDVDHNLE